MLTADLVRTSRRGDELRIVKLTKAGRERALALAADYLALAAGNVGRTRAELGEALGAVATAPGEKKLADGLRKLLDDASSFAVESELEPAAVRAAVFTHSAAAHRDKAFDRSAVLGRVAAELETTAAAVERAMFSDLRSEHVLTAVEPLDAERLVERLETAQAQAVLLRAVRVVAEVRCKVAGAYRSLFRALKFRRLLHSLEELDDGGYRITIDGPYSLFESVTRYGLNLALALPAIQACDQWSLEADVRWGKARKALRFRLAGKGPGGVGEARLPDEVQELVDSFAGRDSGWRARPAERVFELPGVGLCVPDLELVHQPSGRSVCLEVLGFWSREAVWRRVELVEAGLDEPIVFAVSKRLRVAEEVLDDRASAALYVYAGKMSAAAIERKAKALAGG